MEANKQHVLRGMKDIIYDDAILYNYVFSISHNIGVSHCYNYLITPILEHYSVFHRTLGEASDIVSKETYDFNDRSGRKITLRPEFTASVVRALISNGLTQLLPQKFISYGPVFRYDRPQKGRYRQIQQVNFENIGIESVNSDIEVISMAYALTKCLNLDSYIALEINTVGNDKSRNDYKNVLKDYFEKYVKDLSELSKSRLSRNPLRILDSKELEDQDIISNAPSNLRYLDHESRERWDDVMLGLNDLNIKYKVNDKLVRGVDYYTHTVFEFIPHESQGTVIAGGRYDNLVQVMGGPSTPAMGFGMGVDRIVDMLYQYNIANAILDKNIIKSLYLLPIGDEAEKILIKIAFEMRCKCSCSIYLDYGISTKKRFQRANKLKVDQCVIIGDAELQNNKCIVKDMNSGSERSVDLNDIYELIK